MAIDCDLGPPLHIPHLSKPYDDQKLMENFQSIQRWADRLHVECAGCDCSPTGDWTITPDTFTTGATSSIYEFDSDFEMVSLSVEGETVAAAGYVHFGIFKNGVEAYLATLPTTAGPWSETFSPNISFVAGDQVFFVFSAGLDPEDSIAFTSWQANGKWPGLSDPGDPIGSGFEYTMDALARNAAIGGGIDLDTQSDSGPGSDSPIAAEDRPVFGITTAWTPGTSQAYLYLTGQTTNGGVTSGTYELTELILTVEKTGPTPMDIVINGNGMNGGATSSTHTISATTNIVVPIGTDAIWPQIWLPEFAAAYDPPDSFATLTTFTAGLSPDHADEVVTWTGGG